MSFVSKVNEVGNRSAADEPLHAFVSLILPPSDHHHKIEQILASLLWMMTTTVQMNFWWRHPSKQGTISDTMHDGGDITKLHALKRIRSLRPAPENLLLFSSHSYGNE